MRARPSYSCLLNLSGPTPTTVVVHVPYNAAGRPSSPHYEPRRLIPEPRHQSMAATTTRGLSGLAKSFLPPDPSDHHPGSMAGHPADQSRCWRPASACTMALNNFGGPDVSLVGCGVPPCHPLMSDDDY